MLIKISTFDDPFFLQLNSLTSKNEVRKNLSELDEGELFMELIKDVANELDIDVLCHKILVNVGLLTHADRGSLFLVKGNNSQSRYLVAKLFDVTQDTGKHDSLNTLYPLKNASSPPLTVNFSCYSFFALKALDDAIRLAKSEELVIPFGVGIAGHVAETKEVVNIKDAYKDPRFNSEIDLKTGYKTNIILSMAICNYEGDVIGVAQIINKTNGEIIEIDVVVRLMGSFTNVLVTQTGQEEFTERDVEVFKRYLTFCGIGKNKFECGFCGFVMKIIKFFLQLNVTPQVFRMHNSLRTVFSSIRGIRYF